MISRTTAGKFQMLVEIEKWFLRDHRKKTGKYYVKKKDRQKILEDLYKRFDLL